MSSLQVPLDYTESYLNIINSNTPKRNSLLLPLTLTQTPKTPATTSPPSHPPYKSHSQQQPRGRLERPTAPPVALGSGSGSSSAQNGKIIRQQPVVQPIPPSTAPTTAPGEKTSSLRPRLARPNRNNSTTAADGRCMSMVTELICLLIFNLRVQFVFPDTETYKRTKIY